MNSKLKLEEIANRLKALGYFTQLVTDLLIVGTQPKQDVDFPQIGSYHAFCSIQFQYDVYVIEFGRSNISEEIRLSTAEEVLKFVTQRFFLG